jgi:hypothetical protein
MKIRHALTAGAAALVLSACTTLWTGNAITDTLPSPTATGDETTHWDRLESGTLTDRLQVVDNPVNPGNGKAYLAYLTPADIAAGQKRAEFAHAKDVNGARVYAGDVGTESVWLSWSSNFGLPADTYVNPSHENDGNYLQFKGDPNVDCGGPSVGLTIRYGNLALRTVDGAYIPWDGIPMANLLDGQWHSFIMHIYFASDNTGYIDLWVDEEAQVMTNGDTRWFGPTLCPGEDRAYLKMGVYNMDTGIGAGPHHWFIDPTIEVE